MSIAARVIVVVLRVVTAAAAGAAAVVMATSQQETDNFVFGLQLEASFQDAPSFLFFVVANAVACAYSMLAIIVPPASPAARFLLVTDVVSIDLVCSGALGAAGAVSELGKNGNSRAFWQPICGLVQTFCDHVGGALISAFVALVLSFLGLMYSIFTVTKRPPPPSEP